MNINIFRVEHMDYGHGPFSKVDWATNRGLGLNPVRHPDYVKMPAPDDDGIMLKGGPWLFAFPTLQAYIDFWEVTTLQDLRALGFILKEVSCLSSRVIVGRSGWQVMYHNGYSRVITTVDLLDPFYH